MSQGNRSAIRRRLQPVINVVHALQRQRLPRVHFQNHAFGLVDPRLVVADGRTRNHSPVFQHGSHFDQCQIELAQKSVLHELSYVAQVDVHVLHLAGINSLTRLGIRLIGQPQMNAARHSQRAIEFWSGGSAGEDADLKFLSAQVGIGNAARKGQRHRLGITGAGESAHADLVAGVDQCGRIFGAHDAVGQTGIQYTRGSRNRRGRHRRTFPTQSRKAWRTNNDRWAHGRASVRWVTSEVGWGMRR
jgi:hypothetical protein